MRFYQVSALLYIMLLQIEKRKVDRPISTQHALLISATLHQLFPNFFIKLLHLHIEVYKQLSLKRTIIILITLIIICRISDTCIVPVLAAKSSRFLLSTIKDAVGTFSRLRRLSKKTLCIQVCKRL